MTGLTAVDPDGVSRLYRDCELRIVSVHLRDNASVAHIDGCAGDRLESALESTVRVTGIAEAGLCNCMVSSLELKDIS